MRLLSRTFGETPSVRCGGCRRACVILPMRVPIRVFTVCRSRFRGNDTLGVQHSGPLVFAGEQDVKPW